MTPMATPSRILRSLVSGGLVVTALLSLGAGKARGRPPRVVSATAATAAAEASPEVAEGLAPCAPDTVPDGDACVHLPDEDEGTWDALPEATAQTNAHHDRGGRWIVYDQVPRRADRPADYDAYRYPVPCDQCVVSGYDLDLPDALQRRGRRLKQVGHGAVDLLERRGTPVAAVSLEHQKGDAEVLYVGPSSGRPS